MVHLVGFTIEIMFVIYQCSKIYDLCHIIEAFFSHLHIVTLGFFFVAKTRINITVSLVSRPPSLECPCFAVEHLYCPPVQPLLPIHKASKLWIWGLSIPSKLVFCNVTPYSWVFLMFLVRLSWPRFLWFFSPTAPFKCWVSKVGHDHFRILTVQSLNPTSSWVIQAVLNKPLWDLELKNRLVCDAV